MTTTIQDYGHWSTLTEVDLNNYLGFVYIITFENGMKYVGAKKIWKRIKVPPCNFKRGPKKGFEESDWKTYTSSSKEVNSMLEKGINPKEYLIVGWYSTWGKTLLAEFEFQYAHDVLRNPKWLNKQMGGHFGSSCFDDMTQEDLAKYMTLSASNTHTDYPVMYKLGQKTKYVHPDSVDEHLKNGWAFGRSKYEKVSTISVVNSYMLYDNTTNQLVKVVNQNQFAKDMGLEPGHLTKLVKGDIDELADGRWTLPPDIRRVVDKFKFPDGTTYKTAAAGDMALGATRGTVAKLVKDESSGYVLLTPETKADYKKRLASMDIVSTERVELTSKIDNNLKRDVSRILDDALGGREESIAWLESYIKEFRKSCKD